MKNCVKAFQAEVASGLAEDLSKETVEVQWSALAGSLIDAGKKHLGFVNRHQPDWFVSSQDVIAPLLEERRLCYNRWSSTRLANDYSLFKTARS